jgi:phage tail sheath gpL-like
MATTYVQMVVAQDETTANLQRDVYAETGLRELAGLKLEDYMKKATSGTRPVSVKTQVNAAKATGTITLSSHVATDTVTVNGITFTCVASGATGNQYNVGGSDTITGDNLVTALLANATLAAMITAANVAGVVTLTALNPGALGNAITLAISAHGSVSAARMAGGTNGDTETTHFFGSAASTLV